MKKLNYQNLKNIGANTLAGLSAVALIALGGLAIFGLGHGCVAFNSWYERNAKERHLEATRKWETVLELADLNDNDRLGYTEERLLIERICNVSFQDKYPNNYDSLEDLPWNRNLNGQYISDLNSLIWSYEADRERMQK